MDKLNHPCKNTCSGWKQGFESAFQNNMKSYQDCINHLKQFVHLLSQSEDDLQKAEARIKELEKQNEWQAAALKHLLSKHGGGEEFL